MLTKEDLLTLDRIPEVSEVSLSLYKDFAEEFLFKRKFHYLLLDGTTVDIRFNEKGMHHMLGIQHTKLHIADTDLFNAIDNGLLIQDIIDKKNLYSSYPKRTAKLRIESFACIYTVMKNGSAFYFPNQEIKGAIKMDYILYQLFTDTKNHSVNIGIKEMDNCGYLIGRTILNASGNRAEKIIANGQFRPVKEIKIMDMNNNVVYFNNFDFDLL